MTEAGALSFEYDNDYASNPDATPLALSMPLQGFSYGNRAVQAFLQGLLPDNQTALESMARKYQVSGDSPFALLKYVGRDVAGALQIIAPGEQPDDAIADRTRMTSLDDAALTQELRNVINVYDDGALLRGVQRMSLAGTQAKLGVSQTKNGGWAPPNN
jgi:serine/threonine-protein kinase HipA